MYKVCLWHRLKIKDGPYISLWLLYVFICGGIIIGCSCTKCVFDIDWKSKMVPTAVTPTAVYDCFMCLSVEELSLGAHVQSVSNIDWKSKMAPTAVYDCFMCFSVEELSLGAHVQSVSDIDWKSKMAPAAF